MFQVEYLISGDISPFVFLAFGTLTFAIALLPEEKLFFSQIYSLISTKVGGSYDWTSLKVPENTLDLIEKYPDISQSYDWTSLKVPEITIGQS